jgi:hypothetical protein
MLLADPPNEEVSVLEGTLIPLQQPVTTVSHANGQRRKPPWLTTPGLEEQPHLIQHDIPLRDGAYEAIIDSLRLWRVPPHADKGDLAYSSRHPLLRGSPSDIALAINAKGRGRSEKPIENLRHFGFHMMGPMYSGYDARLITSGIMAITHGKNTAVYAQCYHSDTPEPDPIISNLSANKPGGSYSIKTQKLEEWSISCPESDETIAGMDYVTKVICDHNDVKPISFKAIVKMINDVFKVQMRNVRRPAAFTLYGCHTHAETEQSQDKTLIIKLNNQTIHIETTKPPCPPLKNKDTKPGAPGWEVPGAFTGMYTEVPLPESIPDPSTSKQKPAPKTAPTGYTRPTAIYSTGSAESEQPIWMGQDQEMGRHYLQRNEPFWSNNRNLGPAYVEQFSCGICLESIKHAGSGPRQGDTHMAATFHCSIEKETSQSMAWWMMSEAFHNGGADLPLDLHISKEHYHWFIQMAHLEDDGQNRGALTEMDIYDKEAWKDQHTQPLTFSQQLLNMPFAKVVTESLGAMSLQPTGRRGNTQIDNYAFQLLHLDETLRTHLQSAIDESNRHGQPYHDTLCKNRMEEGPGGTRWYSNARLLAGRRYYESDMPWIHYDAIDGQPVPIGLAHPSFTAFITAFNMVNSTPLARIFANAPKDGPWRQIYEDGRLFKDVTVIAYDAPSNPTLELGDGGNVLELTITLGNIWRWLVAISGKEKKYTITLGEGDAYLSSPCLYKHGTRTANTGQAGTSTRTDTGLQGGWRDTNLAMHFRPLVTREEHDQIRDEANTTPWRILLGFIQKEIKNGAFRMPSMHESQLLQIPTLRAEYLQATGTNTRHKKTKQKKKNPNSEEHRKTNKKTPKPKQKNQGTPPDPRSEDDESDLEILEILPQPITTTHPLADPDPTRKRRRTTPDHPPTTTTNKRRS